MKLIVSHFLAFLMLFAVFVFGCTAQSDAPNDETSISEVGEGARVAEIALPGMFCPACARNAETAFRGMNGVIEAEVDIKTKEGRVVYESATTSAEKIIQNPVIQSYDGNVLTDQEYKQ
jgi:copper chaperone CopZ